MTTTTTAQRTTRIYRQLLSIVKAAGLSAVFPRARLMTLTVKNLSYETLELHVHGGDAPDQRILDIRFAPEEGNRLPMRLQETLRLDATGHGIEVYGPGSLYPGRGTREVQACMKVYADKLEQEQYADAVARGYSLWIQFYE